MVRSWFKISLIAIFGLVMFAGGYVAYAAGGQPHMTKALKRLKRAHKQLNEGLHDKSGHRAKAEQLTAQAITETKAGIAAGEEKGGGKKKSTLVSGDTTPALN